MEYLFYTHTHSHKEVFGLTRLADSKAIARRDRIRMIIDLAVKAGTDGISILKIQQIFEINGWATATRVMEYLLTAQNIWEMIRIVDGRVYSVRFSKKRKKSN